ncbi:MAG TPA: hypothetical protein DHW71_15305 [Gammaproteobacteria bacterium]|mgnify:CR=1 FL=1|nr:hypothetical protein [Gammaproteobacteria bacterium]|tara:strand:+ start:6581 stop:7696 length:1116 start_codon:yes stop_codon:yes gene_type:complete
MLKVRHKKIASAKELADFLLKIDLSKTPSSIFTSEDWLTGWISTLHLRSTLLIWFESDNSVVGYTLLTVNRYPSFMPLLKKGWLNQSGKKKFDQIWLEYNEVICLPHYRSQCMTALISYSFNELSLSELYISMSSDLLGWENSAINHELHWKKIPGYKTNISNAHTIENIISDFSKSTRAQLRRSIRKASDTFGAIYVNETPPSELIADFLNLGEVHKAKWSGTADGSGFNNNAFIKHHEYLLSKIGKTSLLKIYAGTTLLGSAYYLLWEDTVYFYCSGLIQSEVDKHIKAGYLLHIFAMRHFSNKGYLVYDFLGGEYQYKDSLCSDKYMFYQVSIYNGGFIIKVLRKLVKSVKKLTSAIKPQVSATIFRR